MFWGVVVENGKKYAQKVESSYHLTMAALDISQKHKGQVSLYLEQNKTEFLLCNLGYDKATHQQLDLVFDADEDVTFFVKGEGNVHLTGYVLPDEYDGLDEDGLDEDDSMDEENEIDEKDLKSLNKLIQDRKRKPELKETNAKKAKLDEKAKADEPEKKNAVANKKLSPAKKVEESDEDSDDSDDDDEELDDEAIQKLLKDKKFEEDDEDDDDDYDVDDESLDEEDEQELQKYKEEIKKKLSNQGNKGILKVGQDDKKKQTPQQNKQQPQKQNSGKKQQQTPKGKPQMNGKNGTPMPVKNANTPNKLPKLPGGVSFQDKVVGSGPEAKKGRHLFVQYIGRLENGEEFDRSKGKPFTFKLGAGQVIKGWEQGMQGMKVGGTRLLTIPPNLGYGDRKMGPIPSKSTLKFEVTLKAVK